MAAFSTFLRSTPPQLLRRYFDQCGGTMPQSLDWTAPRPDLVRILTELVAGWEPVIRARVRAEAERISEMTDDAGQTALFAVTSDRAALDALGSGHARAITMFLDNRTGFRRAEEARYADDRRNGRMWDGFRGDTGLVVLRHGPPGAAFRDAIRERFDSPNVHIDIYDRTRPVFDDEPADLVQVTIYREGRLDEELVFVDGTLDRRSRRPVVEAAITYASESGVIEVVGPDQQTRIDLVRLFARHLLASEFREERLGFRLYDLRSLRRPHAFPVDAADAIEDVKVVMLRMIPLDSQGERLILECSRTSPRTVWEMAAERLGAGDPFRGGWAIVQARLAIRLRAGPHGRTARTLNLNISLPRGCDLKDRTEAERMIGEKYLRRWGLVRDV
jgi:hypothetical protein